VRIGENITFTMTVTNLGPAAAAGVVFGDPILRSAEPGLLHVRRRDRDGNLLHGRESA